jgi:hypothetical protein
MKHTRIHRGTLEDCPAPSCRQLHESRTNLPAVLNSPEFREYARQKDREWEGGKAARLAQYRRH